MKQEDNKMRNRSFGTTMGITSIIAILIILVLVVFSTLSLITSKADLNLSQRTADSIESYYKADSNAILIVAEFGNIIKSGELVDINTDSLVAASKVFSAGNDYEYNTDERSLMFSLPIDKSRELLVEVRYDNNGSVQETKLWQVSPVGEWVEDNDINLFQPEQP